MTPTTFPLLPIRGGVCACGPQCKVPGKHPAVRWSKLAAGEQIPAPPDHGIGLATGERSGIFVLDLDLKDGKNGLAALEALGPVPQTLVVQTPTGGFHLYFTHPGFRVRNSVSALGPGIDVRGDGGYVVMPPSRHKNGGQYSWANEGQEIAEAPAWLLAWLRTETRETKAPSPRPEPTRPLDERLRCAEERLALCAPAIEGQGGRTRTFLVAQDLVRGCELDTDVAFDLLERLWNPRCEPPWDPQDLHKLVDDAEANGEAEWGYLLRAQEFVAALRPETATSRVSRYVVLAASDIARPLPPVDWLVERIGLTHGAPLMIAGYGFSGKTVAAQALALDLAAPSQGPFRQVWRLFPARTKPCRVLHLDHEQGLRLTAARYQRLARARGLALEGLPLGLISLPDLYLDWPATEAELLRVCEHYDVVIVDSLRAAAPGLEENSSDFRRPLDLLTRVADKTGCTGIVIHHARKPTKDAAGGAKTSVRGSGALFDACASVLVFEGVKDGPTLVSHEKSRVSGLLCDDFELRVEDVEQGTGLKVTAQIHEEETEEQVADRARIDAQRQCKLDRQSIRKAFREHDPTAAEPCAPFSREGIAGQIGRARIPARAAWDSLVDRGELEKVLSGWRLLKTGEE